MPVKTPPMLAHVVLVFASPHLKMTDNAVLPSVMLLINLLAAAPSWDGVVTLDDIGLLGLAVNVTDLASQWIYLKFRHPIQLFLWTVTVVLYVVVQYPVMETGVLSSDGADPVAFHCVDKCAYQ
eukprot:NODE_175_length_15885_cov_0.420563.p11 type:complete len:124 gc:universal NODE_175_length_15885_cov_0.420563:10717-10346(-)